MDVNLIMIFLIVVRIAVGYSDIKTDANSEISGIPSAISQAGNDLNRLNDDSERLASILSFLTAKEEKVASGNAVPFLETIHNRDGLNRSNLLVIRNKTGPQGASTINYERFSDRSEAQINATKNPFKFVGAHFSLKSPVRADGNHTNNGPSDSKKIVEDRKELNVSKFVDDWLRNQRSFHDEESFTHYTNQFVVDVPGGEKMAKLVASEHGLEFVRRVLRGENFYLLRHRGLCKRCDQQAKEEIQKLSNDERVAWVSQQGLRVRSRRDMDLFQDEDRNLPSDRRMINVPGTDYLSEVNFNDPFYPKQWYLHNYGQQIGSSNHKDLNILPVWKAGFTGKGINVIVIDDGISRDNPDIKHNHNPALSFDYVETEPQEEDRADAHHGTYCAGITAAVANNSICGVGIAYEAGIGGVKVLDGPSSDAIEAMALTHALDIVDIYTASWGPKDDGGSIGGPGPLAQMAFEQGITHGRQGRGVIYVWASGNGAHKYDNCNVDGFASSIFTIAIGALAESGFSTYYTEPCAAVMASTYVGGFHDAPTPKTIHKYRRKINVVVPAELGDCFLKFQGTSAAAPMAAGLIALTLQANPYLTWRDIQHIIIKAARLPTTKEKGWSINGAGHHFHLRVGFGVMDGTRMVAMAQNWSPVPHQRRWTIRNDEIRCMNDEGRISIALPVEFEEVIDSLEHVVTTIHMRHPRRKDLEIFLTSPSGTISQLLTRRPRDKSKFGLRGWHFTSIHFWDEDGRGIWRLEIIDENPNNRWFRRCIDNAALTLYGTFRNKSKRKSKSRMNLDVDHPLLKKMASEERQTTLSLKRRRLNFNDKL